MRWNEVEAGIADVDGVPEELLRAFSTRRAEIEASLADHGGSGARAAEAAALATRKNKDRSVSSTDLLAKWREQAAELGWSEERVAGLCNEGRALGLESGVATNGFTKPRMRSNPRLPNICHGKNSKQTCREISTPGMSCLHIFY